jgi:undecaprenyl-diphosphatase
MLCGTLVAAVAGIIALVVLLRIVKRGRIHLFAYYCWAVGLVAIALGIFKG